MLDIVCGQYRVRVLWVLYQRKLTYEPLATRITHNLCKVCFLFIACLNKKTKRFHKDFVVSSISSLDILASYLWVPDKALSFKKENA